MTTCVNLQLLKSMIKDSGYRMQFVAAKLNVSRATLINRLEGRQPFTIDEVNTLIWLLRLTPEQVNDIFFDQSACLRASA